jgi:hypothetical protein
MGEATTVSLMKARQLIAAAAMVAIGCIAPAGRATAAPIYPVPFMQHDGTYLVGTEIKPGLYLTLGGAGGGTCSWSRLSSVGSGDATNTIDHGESPDAQYAVVAPTDKAFETHGCQAWSIKTRPATPIDPVPKTCIYPLTGCQDPEAQRPTT